jgi:hypothetical protein
VTTPDKPSHFNLTTFVQWQDHAVTPRTRTRIMLQGMTDREPADLVPLARSWLNAPELRIVSAGYLGGTYDPAERAYWIDTEEPRASGPCRIVVDASADAPLVNPAFILRGWGDRPATLSIDGRDADGDADFRQGIRRRPDGEDLILWLRLSREQPVELVVTVAGGDRR